MPTIIGPIIPGGADFAAMDDLYLGGGFRVVATAAERDAIPAGRRKAGMEVYVQQDGARYRLGSDLNSWTTILEGGAGQGVINLVEAGLKSGSNSWRAQNSAALQSVVNTAPEGSVLYLPPGKYYLDPAAPVTATRTLHWRGIPGESWLINGESSSTGMNAIAYLTSPNATPTTTLKRSHFPGETELEVANASGLAAGMWIVVRDNANKQVWHNDPGFDAWNEELVWIEEINGNVLKINRPLVRRYLPGREAAVYKFSVAPMSPVFDGISWERCRVDIAYGVNVAFLSCVARGCDWNNYSLRHCEYGYLFQCRTEVPKNKTTSGLGAAFYLHHSKFIQVDHHMAQQCEGAVLRRGTWYCLVTNSVFTGMNTGLAMDFGDCRYNVVSNCVFDRAMLVWGGGGNFGDSYNASYNCVFRRSPVRAIGGGSTAYRSVDVTYDGRAFKTVTEHGCDNGQPVVLGGTWPSPLVEGKRYWMVAVTANSGDWNNEFLLSERAEHVPVGSATFSTVTRSVTLNTTWKEGDAVVFQGISMPGGVDGNRIYFLKERVPGDFYLQKRPGQTATFDAGTELVTLTGSLAGEWLEGQPVMFVTTGTLPTGVNPAPAFYWLRNKSGANSFRLEPGGGGPLLELTDNGTGTHYALLGVTSTPSSPVSAEGGRPLVMSGSGTSMVILTAGEGNTYDGHEIHDPPENAVYIFRGTGMRFRNLRFVGEQNPTLGTTLFVFGNCTDVDISHIWAENSVDAVNNRVLHSAGSFGVRLRGCRFDMRNSTGSLITGGTSSGLELTDVDCPGITSRGALVYSPLLPAISRIHRIRLGNGFWTGRDGSMQVLGDVSVNHALPGDTANVLVWSSNLTANRVVKLDNTRARTGDWIRVVRTGGGAFSLQVQRESDSGVLFEFDATPKKGWVEFDWDGTAWVRTGWHLE